MPADIVGFSGGKWRGCQLILWGLNGGFEMLSDIIGRWAINGLKPHGDQF